MDVFQRFSEYADSHPPVIVFSTIFSADGNFLLSGDSSGSICVFDLAKFFNPSWTGKIGLPEKKICAHHSVVYSLLFIDKKDEPLVASGSMTEIKLWRFSSLLSQEEGVPEPLIVIQTTSEANGLIWDGKHILYSACGNNLAVAHDLNTGVCVGTFIGHTDYLHCLALRKNGQLVTAGEDGALHFWDPQTYSLLYKVTPSLSTKSTRSSRSRDRAQYISCLDIDSTDTWLVCGTSARCLYLIHLPSKSISHIRTAGVPQAVRFHNGQVVCCGNDGCLATYSLHGKPRTHTDTSSASLFALAINRGCAAKQAVVAAGDSGRIDVFIDLSALSFSLSVL
eukprot:GCRY01004695.1.p1 GENE.GCRY01004695.1~~GCRY01004695.1.p1  ORF type:complete len:337 (+),score=72.52 GCRY01004695.1:296-1306(+)